MAEGGARLTWMGISPAHRITINLSLPPLRFFDAFQKITSDIILDKSKTNFGPWVISV